MAVPRKARQSSCFNDVKMVFFTHNFTPVSKLRNLTTCLFHVANIKCAKFSSLSLVPLLKIDRKKLT